MKKLLIILLTAVISLFFSGCVTSYTPPGDGGSGSGSGENPGGNPGDETPFTVSLETDGTPYFPETPMSAQWYNGESLVSAEFENGVATAYGLDGNYRVTLTDIPEGYAYDANAAEYTATNRKKDVTIKLEKLQSPMMGDGTGWYNKAFDLTQTGYYKFSFSSLGQSIYCRFSPDSGTYSIESVCDTLENAINPRFEYYGQNRAYTPSRPYSTEDKGGASGKFTKNFKYQVSIDGDCVNFVIKCNVSLPEFPVDVYVRINFTESYSRNPVYEMKIPEQIYDGDGEVKVSPAPEGSYIKCGQEEGNVNHILDGSKFELGEDGYYHFKDENGNLTSSIVYMELTHFLQVNIQEGDDGQLYDVPTNVKVGQYDYTYFLKGWDGIVKIYGSVSEVPVKYRHLEGGKGYTATALSDNKCAVTAELREFLRVYCAARQLFFDGLGSAESAGYNSSDEDQWLYFCGYYR